MLGFIKMERLKGVLNRVLSDFAQDLFNRTSRKVKKSSLMDKPDTPNRGLFERSLTLEEEEIMANTRR